jgi:hypothetical protein
MRKLTSNELMRNGMYATIAEADFGEFKAVGNVKQGFLFKDAEGKSVVVKVILKKDEVDYDEEAVERPTEQVEDEEDESTEEAVDSDESDDEDTDVEQVLADADQAEADALAEVDKENEEA